MVKWLDPIIYHGDYYTHADYLTSAFDSCACQIDIKANGSVKYEKVQK